jgi:hypothetical protein
VIVARPSSEQTSSGLPNPGSTESAAARNAAAISSLGYKAAATVPTSIVHAPPTKAPR